MRRPWFESRLRPHFFFCGGGGGGGEGGYGVPYHLQSKVCYVCCCCLALSLFFRILLTGVILLAFCLNLQENKDSEKEEERPAVLQPTFKPAVIVQPQVSNEQR